MSFDMNALLDIVDLSVSFRTGAGPRMAIEHVSFAIRPGETLGLVGESGSGKTELAHVVARGLRAHGIFAKPMHIDNYYKVLPLERKQWRIDNVIEKCVGFDEYDWGKGTNQPMILFLPAFSTIDGFEDTISCCGVDCLRIVRINDSLKAFGHGFVGRDSPGLVGGQRQQSG